MIFPIEKVNFEVPFYPVLKEAGIFGHVYGNFGNCVGLRGYDKAAAKGALRDLGTKVRASYGVGLVWPSPIGKLEVNFCRVARAFEHDKWRNGFHFGFSTSALDYQK